MTALVFGWLGTVLLLAFNIPQVWRTCVQGLTAGVPASRAWVAIAVATLWLGYGLEGGGLVQVVLNGTTIVLNIALLVGLQATRQPGGLTVALLSAATTIALGGLGGKDAIGGVGAVVGCGVCLPQLMAMRRRGSIEGVSAVALGLQLSGAACWLAYGALRAEVVVWAPNVLVLLTATWTYGLLRAATRAAKPLRHNALSVGGTGPLVEVG